HLLLGRDDHAFPISIDLHLVRTLRERPTHAPTQHTHDNRFVGVSALEPEDHLPADMRPMEINRATCRESSRSLLSRVEDQGRASIVLYRDQLADENAGDQRG